VDEADVELELPDIQTLVNQITSNQKGKTSPDLRKISDLKSRRLQRRKRVIYDDDDINSDDL